MTRNEKCQLAIEKGYTYDPETGFIYGCRKKQITRNTNGYIQMLLYVNKKQYKLFGHQFAWYCEYKECVEMLDHINRIKTDNRICNLRAVTNQQNQFNLSKAKGYTFIKKYNKYQSQITTNQKIKYLGWFNTEEEARQAYLAAKQIYHVI